MTSETSPETTMPSTEEGSEGHAEAASEGADPGLRDRLAQLQNSLREDSKVLSKLATTIGGFVHERAFADLAKAGTALDRLETDLAEQPALAERAGSVLTDLKVELERRRTLLREKLAPELRAACEAAGLEMRVVRREEPVELRIPPFAIEIDRKRGVADVLFAKLPLETGPATPAGILGAREKALRSLGTNFDPAAFFEACRTAWAGARGAGLGGQGDRVEINSFLPYLALQFQTKAFGEQPEASRYRGYGRARFAFDLMQLRRAGGLSRDGWRLNLGVATGTTASKKGRSLFVEDEQGNGEFKLTVFFTRTESDS